MDETDKRRDVVTEYEAVKSGELYIDDRSYNEPEDS